MIAFPLYYAFVISTQTLSDASSLFLGQTLNPNAGGYMP